MGCSLPNAARETPAFICALSAGEKPPSSSTWRHTALNRPLWDREKRRGGRRFSCKKGAERFPSHPSAFQGHSPPRFPWKSDAPDGRCLCGTRCTRWKQDRQLRRRRSPAVPARLRPSGPPSRCAPVPPASPFRAGAGFAKKPPCEDLPWLIPF